MISSKSWTIKSIALAIILRSCLLLNSYSSVTRVVRTCNYELEQVSQQQNLSLIPSLVYWLFSYSTSMQCRFSYFWSMCKHNANSGTKEGIRCQSWFFSIAEKAAQIASATVKNSEWMTVVIWDFLGVAIWRELINMNNHISKQSNNESSLKTHINNNWIRLFIWL